VVAGVGCTIYNHTMDHYESTTSLATSKKGLEHMSGKGSRPRPYSVSQAQFGSNWDAIFGNKTKTLDSEQDKISRYNQETQQTKSTQQSQGKS
jgi:hypothetical protein